MSDIDYTGNTQERVPCVVVLDCSGSMAGDPINELNAGLKQFKTSLMEDGTAKTSVCVSLITVGWPDNSASLLMDFTDAVDFKPVELSANGMTPLGAGINLALDKIQEFKDEAKTKSQKYKRPWLFVMSDGAPTDPSDVWAEAVRRANEAVVGNKAVIFPIAVEKADTNKLQEISQKEVAKMSGVEFQKFFVWLSASLSRASKVNSGTDVQLPAIDSWAVVKGGRCNMNDADTIKYVEEQLKKCKPLQLLIVVFSGRCFRKGQSSLSDERMLIDEEWLILPKEQQNYIDDLKSHYDSGGFWEAASHGYYKLRVISNNRQCVFEYGRIDRSSLEIQNFMQPAIIFNLPDIEHGGARHSRELHEFINELLSRPDKFPRNRFCYD